MSVIQNLEQNVHYVGMRFFNLVKEHHGIWFPPYFFCQLTRLIVSHVSRRRTDNTGDGKFFHEFRHIQANQALRSLKQIFCQAFDQFCFSDT